MTPRSLTQLLLGACLAFATPAVAGNWEEVYTAEGVTVSKKDTEGTPLVAFKGETVYDVPVEDVMGVLLDNEHRIEWVDRLYTNHIVEAQSPYDYVLYQAFDLPAMFADRDYVYHGVASRDASTGVVTLNMQSIEHPKAPATVGVRAELLNSRYILTPLENNTKTRVEVEIQTDPKGWMPAWLTNMVQKDWPLETLNGIRGQFAKPHHKPHALPGMDAVAPEPAEAPVAEAPAGDAPATDAPTSDAPATDAPATDAPAPDAAPAPQ